MCDYFILTKDRNSNINDDDNNQIISLNQDVYILPKNDIKYYIEKGLFEKNLIEWCKQFCEKNKNILDIGAHSGTYSISLANYCKHVYAFEPQKMTFYSLCGSIALSGIKNVSCLNYGLGSIEQVGIQKLNIISIDGGGSTLHTNNLNHRIIQQEDIEIRTLDSFNISDIGFIKVDVEENELQVLLGGIETICKSNYPKILFEMNVKNSKLIEFLVNLKYNIVPINGYENMYLASML